MVYKLYNLTYEEVKIINPEIEKIISKEDYEKFEIEIEKWQDLFYARVSSNPWVD